MGAGGEFLHGCPDPWLSYCLNKCLALDLHQVVNAVERAPDYPPEILDADE